MTHYGNLCNYRSNLAKELARQHHYLLSNIIIGFVSKINRETVNKLISVQRLLYFYKCLPFGYGRFKQTTDFRRKLFTNPLVIDSLFLRGVLASITALYSRVPGLIRGVFGPLLPYTIPPIHPYHFSHLRFKIFVWNATGVKNKN